MAFPCLRLGYQQHRGLRSQGSGQACWRHCLSAEFRWSRLSCDLAVECLEENAWSWSTMNNPSYEHVATADRWYLGMVILRFAENPKQPLWKPHKQVDVTDSCGTHQFKGWHPAGTIPGTPSITRRMELNVTTENSAWISFVNSWFIRNMMMHHYLELTEWSDSVDKSQVKGHHQNVPNGSSQLL